MRAREVKAALLAERAKIERAIEKIDTERAALVDHGDDINRFLAMLDAPTKARKPRTPKAPPQTPPAEGEKGGA